MADVRFIMRLVVAAVLLGAHTSDARAVISKAGADPANDAPPAAEADVGDLASLLEPIRSEHELPSLAGAVVFRGELVAIGAVGVRRAGGEERITIDDLFHLGSCTKAMTATLIGLLIDDELLTWSTTIGEVFDDVAMDEAWKPVTIEQLLQNRGGAPADLHADGLWGQLWQFDGTPREARMKLVRGVLQHPPHPVGEYLYSNAGYAIAGSMVERVIDASWEDLMRQRLFEPLGMHSAGFGPPGAGDAEGHVTQPRGHRASGSPVEPVRAADNPDAIAPAGKVHCSLADWAKFIALHVSPGRSDRNILRSDTLARMHTPADGSGRSYAAGWLVTTRSWAKADKGDWGVALTHAGSNTFWFAVTWLAPERELAVLVATNKGSDRAARACDEAAGVLIRHALSAIVPEPIVERQSLKEVGPATRNSHAGSRRSN
jgi:CubicO group peptidase (beta-lactamase class C family)